MTIGEKIKMLRKIKEVTQEELAQQLCISSQAISKWENSIAQPDIAILPSIASYFGISMDELFDYKNSPLTAKQQFIRFMYDNGVLKLGQFDLSAGGQSNYYIDTEKFVTNAQIAKIGTYFADCIRENAIEFDTIVGMAYHGLAFSSATAIQLFEKYGITRNYCIDRQVADSRGRIICGHTLQDGERIIIVDDLINSGKTIINRIDSLKQIANVEIAAIVVIANLMDQSLDEKKKSGAELVYERYGAKTYSIVTSEDIQNAIKNGVMIGK